MIKISLFHHFPGSDDDDLQKEITKLNAKLDNIKDQLDRIESKLDDADGPLREAIMDKLNSIITDIQGTIK